MIVHKGQRLRGVKFAACKGPKAPFDASDGRLTSRWALVTCDACARYAGYADLAGLRAQLERGSLTVFTSPGAWDKRGD